MEGIKGWDKFKLNTSEKRLNLLTLYPNMYAVGELYFTKGQISKFCQKAFLQDYIFPKEYFQMAFSKMSIRTKRDS